MSDTVGPAMKGMEPHRADAAAAKRPRQIASWQAFGPVLVFAAMLLMVSIRNPAFLGGTGISRLRAAGTDAAWEGGVEPRESIEAPPGPVGSIP